MATDNDVTRLTVEITNLEFATRCFREAAGVRRAQRDEARREAYALRHRIHIAALVIVVTVLLVIGVVACVEATETARPQHLVRIDRAAGSNGWHGTGHRVDRLQRTRRLRSRGGGQGWSDPRGDGRRR